MNNNTNSNIEQFINYIGNYTDKLDTKLIIQALEVASFAHKDQKRSSGEPYINHPINIATNLIDYNFDTSTIIASLLHDVLEDTHVTENDLKQHFNQEVINLVNGVTKLTNLQLASKEEAKLENFRKFILAVTKDIRVLIIKLFDRLDNIRSIEYIPEVYKRKRISLETLQIYVPLAERIGLYQIKDELEDKCFFILEPIAYRSVQNEIDLFTSKNNLQINNIIQEINNILLNNKLNVEIEARVKKTYSVWQKIKSQGVSFNEIFDIVGLRFKTTNVADCYRVLYFLHSNYTCIQDRFKDYISNPKANGYKSIHTGLWYNNASIKLDIQIRTIDMHKFAESGIAAHWNYKTPTTNALDVNQYAWLKNFLNLLNQDDISSKSLYEYSKIELYSNQIFTFTPKGKLVVLPQDSCVLDFAYAIHTNLGNTAISAVINSIEHDLFTKLKNGQIINIISYKHQEPSSDWLSVVKTGLAKHSITKYLKTKHKNKLLTDTIVLLQYICAKNNMVFSAMLLPQIMQALNVKSEAILCEQILQGNISEEDILKAISINSTNKVKTKHKNNYSYSNVINIDHLKNHISNINMANCCYKIVGDKIIAVTLPGNKVEIHHSDCQIMYEDFTNSLNIVRADWQINAHCPLNAKLLIIVNAKYIITSNILNLLAKRGVFINSLDIKQLPDNMLELIVTMQIENVDKLNYLIKSFLLSKSVIKITRLIN